ncbi:hypothetical protein T10_6227 [Trichinella papuae]|uniref:Uncharacterized protein n=1 Tax=Trichinella papuae TaxID=268474 RepID=A0A0V1M9Y5_9BILA|nr:hypothetical protein T10_6227 [Trichinella papuae]
MSESGYLLVLDIYYYSAIHCILRLFNYIFHHEEKLDADSQCVHFYTRWSEENFIFTTWICVDSDEDYEQQAEMKGLFTLSSRCANRSHRQVHCSFILVAFAHFIELLFCIVQLDAMIRRLGGRIDDTSVVFLMYGDSLFGEILVSDMNITAKRVNK